MSQEFDEAYSLTAHVWPAELRVDELVALDERDAQLSRHDTTPRLYLQGNELHVAAAEKRQHF
jgi:hypothetical protein